MYGKAENEVRWKQWRTVTETFKGYAEVRLNHAFPLFFNRFKEGLNEIAGYREHADRIQRIPDSMIEVYVYYSSSSSIVAKALDRPMVACALSISALLPTMILS